MFGILGITIIIYIIFRIYPKINKYAIENIKNSNNEIVNNDAATYLFNEKSNEKSNENENTKEENPDLLDIIEIKIQEFNV